MNLASLCTRDVVVIDAGASPREAAALMCEQHVGSLVVVNGGAAPQVAGIVTDRDLALDVVGRARPAVELTVGDLLKGAPLAAPGTATVREAVAIMENGGVRRLLVLDEEQRVIGLVSADDLLAAIAEELESLSRALRQGIAREQAERKVMSGAIQPRPVFPAFGTAAMQ